MLPFSFVSLHSDRGFVSGVKDVQILKEEQPVHRKMSLGPMLIEENITWETKTKEEESGKPLRQMIVDFRWVDSAPFFQGNVLNILTETNNPEQCSLRFELRWTPKEGAPPEMASRDMSGAIKGAVEASAKVCEQKWEEEKKKAAV
jgi:Domain of unknown function (DUF1857)